jgi:hypothetical protein
VRIKRNRQAIFCSERASGRAITAAGSCRREPRSGARWNLGGVTSQGISRPVIRLGIAELNQDFLFVILGSTHCTSKPLCWNRFLILSILSGSSGPGRGQRWLLRVRKNPGLPDFKPFLIHLSVPLLPSTCLLPRRCALSGRHGQCRCALWAPPHHASKKPPRQMALCQQQPVISRVLDQTPTCRYQPLLQASQGPAIDLVRQHRAQRAPAVRGCPGGRRLTGQSRARR